MSISRDALADRTNITYRLRTFSGALLPKYNSALAATACEAKKIIDDVKSSIAENRSRNFAIVHVMGKQRRVTDGDLLIVEGHWPPSLGDRVNFDKVLLAGSDDFTLIGRPVVQPGLVKVTGTVVGKTLSTTRTHFRKKRRKQYMRIAFMRAFQTTVRINRVKIGSNLDCQ